jgi:transposase
MTDAEYALILPHLPAQPLRGRRRRTDLRAVVDGIFYVLQNGCPWANLPKDFPPKSTVYFYFQRFSQDGTWARIHDALYVECRDLEGREAQPSAAIIDSQSVKTGPNACETVGYDAGKKIKGRKRHILTDTLGLLLKADVHSAGIQDRDGAARLFAQLTARFPFLPGHRFPDPPQALDRRANPRLDLHQSTPRKGLRTLCQDRCCLYRNRHDQAHDTTIGKILTFLNGLLDAKLASYNSDDNAFQPIRAAFP